MADELFLVDHLDCALSERLEMSQCSWRRHVKGRVGVQYWGVVRHSRVWRVAAGAAAQQRLSPSVGVIRGRRRLLFGVARVDGLGFNDALLGEANAAPGALGVLTRDEERVIRRLVPLEPVDVTHLLTEVASWLLRRAVGGPRARVLSRHLSVESSLPR